MKILALLIVFWSSLVLADPSCRQLSSNLPGIISFENQESLSNYSMVLENGPEVVLEYQKVKNREGDEITILGRRDTTRSRWLGRHNTARLWSRLLERYYLSFTIGNNLLPNQSRSKISYGQESLDRLLSVQNVNNPRFPKLRPAVVKHEDYHLDRLEYDSFKRWEAAYETGNRQQDLPDLEVTSGISYKFSGHGDSHKNSISYLGQRFELRIPYQTKVPDTWVYQKARFNDKGVVTARILVIKTPKGTSRVRLAVGMTQNIASMISEILSRDYHVKIDPVRPGHAIMILRGTVKIVIGRKMEDSIVIGRLSIDNEAYLQKEISENILMGQESILGKHSSVSEISSLGETLEHAFHEKNSGNHVYSEQVKLNIDFDKSYQGEINSLIQDIGLLTSPIPRN